MWTNTSLPPPSTSINPKPFCALNHFTVPVFAIVNASSFANDTTDKAPDCSPPTCGAVVGRPRNDETNIKLDASNYRALSAFVQADPFPRDFDVINCRASALGVLV
jgi:hypothetical protein